MNIISKETYNAWKDQPILHDEDEWMGKYKTFGEMWAGEGYVVEQTPDTRGEPASPRKKAADVYPYNPHSFGEYDLEQLAQAKKLLQKVYEYHYGDSHMRKQLGRLETIINKLDELKAIG